jgi:hypothetical protein
MMQKSFIAEKIFITLFALAIIYQIFVPPVVGLADNGDFSRIIDKVGIIPTAEKQYLGNIDLVFQIEPRFTLKGYQSSELFFVYASILLNGIFSKDGQYYILILAAIHVAALLVCIWLILRGIHAARFHAKWVIYACMLLFFTDVGYVAYLNSLYSEPASLIFLALVFGVFFLVLQRASAGEVSLAWILAFFAASLLFVVAKPQNAAMGIFLAYLGFRIFLLLSPKGFSPKARKWVGGAFAAGLVVISFLFFAFGLPRYYRSGDLWNSVFLEIVGHSNNPVQDLQELGLSPDMVIYKSTSAFSAGVKRQDFEDFQHSWLYFRIFKFYVVHPDRLFALIDSSTSEAFILQPENLGNFTISENSFTRSKAFAVWNNLRDTALPKSIWTLVGWLAINIAAIIIKVRKFDHSPTERLISEAHLTIVLMAVFQYLTVIMAEGTFELTKHMFLFNILMDVSLIFVIAYLVSLIPFPPKNNSSRSVNISPMIG